jgi:photosystem II stability/assembly factor-like uncharacterized protein
LLITGCAPIRAAVTGWDIVLQVNVQHPTIAAEFLDETFGIVVDDASALHITTDGGQTWTRAANNLAQSRAGLNVVNERVMWLVGAGGRVWTSTDGGQNWQAVARLPYGGHVEFISFLDERTGWAASAESRQLWATGDGGRTWKEIALPQQAGGLATITLRTTVVGYLLDRRGVLFTTQDGGQTWSSQTMGLDESLSIPVLTPSAAIRFLDEHCGIGILGLAGDGKSEVWAMRTTDEGQSWDHENVPVPIGQFYLTHDGTLLTVADLADSGKITVLRTTRAVCAGGSDSGR